MKKNNFLDGQYILSIGFIVSVLFLVNGIFLSAAIRNSYSERIISALGAMSVTYGDMDKAVVDSVLNGSSQTYGAGLTILKRYGYNLSGPDLIKNAMNQEIVFASLFMFSIILFLLISLTIMYKNHMKFLGRLDRYLDEFNSPGTYKEESNPYTRNLVNKLRTLSLDARHNLSLIQIEKEKMHDFMEDLSHQMKTPLTVAHLYIERYIFENIKQDTDKLEAGLKQLEKMTLLINSYLKIGMLKSCNVKLEVKDCNIYSFMEECMADVEPLAADNETDIIIEGDTEAEFQFDAFWMKEAVINLLKNSIEHSPESSKITIEFHKNSHDLRIRIIDEGSGIEEKNIPIIFERFTSSIRQKDGSNGLGLGIAKQAVGRHFGRIGIMNNKDLGVTFEIRLPNLKGKEVYNNYYDVR